MSMTPGLNVTFKVYQPFRHPGPGGYRNFVIYALRSNGSRRRVGSLDLGPGDAEAFLAMWERAGNALATADELGLSGPAEGPVVIHVNGPSPNHLTPGQGPGTI